MKKIRIIVNGFAEEIETGTTLSALIELFREQSPSLIVEVNGRFVHPRDYDRRPVQSGDRVEMIQPAFGG
jgi:thiamine biosynthesis protein ThiS